VCAERWGRRESDFPRTATVLSLAKKKAIVGLDIGSSTLKAVELKAVGTGYKLAALAFEPVPHASIVDGAIIDSGAVADAIGRLFAHQGFTTKNVAASLSGNAVIVKKITMPVMTDKELAQSIRWEAEQHIPFDIQDVHIDYEVLGPRAKGSNGTMEVLLVAAKKDKVASYTSVISQAGRVPVVVDVDAFALQNAYEVNYGSPADTVVALVNVGASGVNINILSAGQSLFSRDISIGGNAYTEALQKELNLPFEQAEEVKKSPESGGALEGIQPVLDTITNTMLLEIQKTFDFFKTTASRDRIDRVVLSGGVSSADGFAQAIEDRFATPVELFDPFRNIAFGPQRLDFTDFDQVAPTAAVAVGLALRAAGYR
jgi:type IV pilus assembly protein PilM